MENFTKGGGFCGRCYSSTGPKGQLGSGLLMKKQNDVRQFECMLFIEGKSMANDIFLQYFIKT